MILKLRKIINFENFFEIFFEKLFIFLFLIGEKHCKIKGFIKEKFF